MPDFPPMLLNVPLETFDERYVGRPDGWFDAEGVAVQVHSRQFHQGTDDKGGDRWANTVERDMDFTALGIPVVPVTPWTLQTKPQRFLHKVDATLRTARLRPRPQVPIRKLSEQDG